MKASIREYYYIDWRRAIDATKYRIHMLDEKIKANSKPTQEKKEFSCPQCKAQWTTMEVLDSVDPQGRASGFLCLTCQHPLDSIHLEGAAEPENDDTQAKFNRQFKPLLDLMEQIDRVTIPAIEGEEAVRNAIEVPRNQDLNPSVKHEPVPVASSRPTAVTGINTAPEKIEISIAAGKDYEEQERIAERERQAKIAAQNQLPDWHTKSTVTDKQYGSTGADSKPVTNGVSQANSGANVKNEEVNKERDPTLDAYFAALEAENRRQAAEDEEEDEEVEDEFEDVVVTAAEGPDVKRVKMESSAASSPAKGGTPVSIAVPSPAGDQESDEDDEEFESVV